MAWNGNCIHEHGHAIGQADLIEYGENRGWGGIGSFDLMADGTFGATNDEKNLSKRPFHCSALTKIRYGWMAPVVVLPNPTANVVRIYPTEGGSGTAIVKLTTATADDYFLLELRTPKGFDTDMNLFALKGDCKKGAVVVYHVNGATVAPNSVYFYDNTINTLAPPAYKGQRNPAQRGYTIVAADGSTLMTAPNQNTVAYAEGSCGILLGKVGKSMSAGKLFSGASSGITIKLQKRCSDNSVLVEIKGGGTALKNQRKDTCK